MKNNLTSIITRTITFAVSFITISTWAAAPVAIWEGDFGESTKAGFSLSLNGNTLNADGTITISDQATLGVSFINPDAAYDASTVIFEVEGLSIPSTDGAALVSTYSNQGGYGDYAGIRLNTNGETWGIWNNNKWGDAGNCQTHRTNTAEELSGTKRIALTYYRTKGQTSSGTHGYMVINGVATKIFGATGLISTTLGFGAKGWNVLGANNATTAGRGVIPMKGATLKNIAFFNAVLSETEIAAYRWPSELTLYKPFLANFSDRIMTITSTGNANAGVDLGGAATFALFNPAIGADTATTFTGNQNTTALPGQTQSELAWRGWASIVNGATSKAYSAPGLVMRFPEYVSGRSITVGGTFAPFTVGGLIVEENASSGDVVPSWTQASGNRYTELGDKRESGGVPTFFVLRDSFKIVRGDNDASKAGVQLYGDITFDIAADKYFDCNTSKSNGKIELKPGAIFRMVGEGVFKVTTLTATGSVSLDYSAQGERVNETAFINGNLMTDASTKFIFPTLAEDTPSMSLCSGDLTAANGVYEITVDGETFFAQLTFDMSAKTVSYHKVGANVITVDEDISWYDIENSGEYIDDLPVELILSQDVRISFDSPMTKTVPQLTIKGDHTATFVLGEYMPTFANGIVLDGDSTYECEIGTDATLFGTALTIPAGITYTIVGGDDEAVDWADKLTVNGTLKTKGKLNLNGANEVNGGTLEIVDGEVAYTSAGQGIKNGGTLTIDAGAKVVAKTSDTLSYANDTKTLNIYGTLEFVGTRWTIMGDCHMNVFGGAQIVGTGDKNGSLDMHTGLTASAVEDRMEATISAPIKYTDAVTFTVDDGMTLVLAGAPGNAYSTLTKAGAGTLKFTKDQLLNGLVVSAGKLELANDMMSKAEKISGAGAVEITGGAYTNVFAAGFTGTKTVKGGELVLIANHEGAVTVEEGGTLKLEVTAEQLVAGYTASEVTLPAGMNLIFVTPTGEEKEGEGNSLPPSGIEWSGKGGNTNWSTPANWTTGKVPSATDNVSIPGEVEITLAEGDVCGNLVVNGAVTLIGDLTGIGGVNIMLDKTLTIVEGTLTCDVAGEGKLIVPEESTLSFSNSEESDQTIAVEITGAGTVQKLGEGATILTHANTYTNTVIAAGTLKLGQQNCLGPWGYSAGILVKEGATLDINGIMVLSNGETYAPRFEEGATLTNSGSFSGDPKASVISKIVALGDMTINVPDGTKVQVARHYNGQCYVELGENTITKTGLGELILGGGCIINGTGTFKVEEGLVSTCHTSGGGQPRCTDGAIEVAEDATFQLRTYTGNTSFTAKKLVNNGKVVSSGTMTVTGEASGAGTFEGALALGEGCSVTPPSQSGASFPVTAQTITREEPFTLDEVVLVNFSPLAEGKDVTVTVPADKPFGTSAVLSGTGTLIKEGEGTFTLSGVSPYEGVIDVKAGTLVVGVGTTGSTSPHDGPLGKYYIDATTWTTNAIIRNGATLNLNGKADQTYGFLLKEGATLKNAAGNIGEGNRQTKYLVLDGDATVDATAAFGLHNGGNAKTILDLGDYTLTKIGTSSFDLVNTEIKGAGTIDVAEGSLKTYTSPSTAEEATINLGDNGTLNLEANLTVKNLTGSGTVSGSARVTVTGMIADTVTTDNAKVTLADGAAVLVVAGYDLPDTWTYTGKVLIDASNDMIASFIEVFKTYGAVTIVSWGESFNPKNIIASDHLKAALTAANLTVVVDEANRCLKLAKPSGFMLLLK